MIILEEWSYKLILEEQNIPDILLLKPTVINDDRGYFIEVFRQSIFEKIGKKIIFVQENIVSTKNSGVIRGLHYQLSMPQGKLIHVISGEILDVAVDIREGSPYFGQHVTINLNSNNNELLYIPEGFAHGYLAMKSNTIIQYKCTNYYHPESEYGIIWNDSEINISWGISNPFLSKKDSELPTLKEQKYLPSYKWKIY